MDQPLSVPPTSLWRQSAFMTFWAGQSVSMLGTEITTLALPLTAVLVLKATPAEMGLLSAMETLPFLLVGLFVGVWVDRSRRRPILLAADLGRALLLGAVPLSLALGILSLPLLLAITFAFGVLTVFFDVTYQSYLPVLVGREHISEANSKLESSRSTARIVGPGLAGGIVQWLSAPVAISFDALSFLASGLSLALIRIEEDAPVIADGSKRQMGREIVEGLRVVLGNPLLRALAGATGTSNLFSAMCSTLTVLYMTNELHISPAIMGIIFALGSPGALLGALLATRIARRFGYGPTIIVSIFVLGLGVLLMPLASGSPLAVAAFFVASVVVVSFSGVIYGITGVSLRQTITPNRLLGRMNASMRFFVWGTLPLGSLIGGALGGLIGLRPTLVIGALGSLFAVLWVLFSPVRTLRDLPAVAE